MKESIFTGKNNIHVKSIFSHKSSRLDMNEYIQNDVENSIISIYH